MNSPWQPHLVKLKALCEAWGGHLFCVSKEEYDKQECYHFYEAPFTNGDLGTNILSRSIWYTERCPTHPSSVCHEMGHLFVAHDLGYPLGMLGRLQEYDFLGWEYTLTLSVGVTHEEWVEENRHYRMGNGQELKDISAETLKLILQERITHAETIGILRDGMPLPRVFHDQE